MPLIVRGTSYTLPKQDGRSGPTGSEIDAIETQFGVDYYDLMSVLMADGDTVAKKGCTRNRALYALAWLTMHRVDTAVTIAGVMDEYAADELNFTEDEEPAPQPDLPTPADDVNTESAATS